MCGFILYASFFSLGNCTSTCLSKLGYGLPGGRVPLREIGLCFLAVLFSGFADFLLSRSHVTLPRS